MPSPRAIEALLLVLVLACPCLGEKQSSRKKFDSQYEKSLDESVLKKTGKTGGAMPDYMYEKSIRALVAEAEATSDPELRSRLLAKAKMLSIESLGLSAERTPTQQAVLESVWERMSAEAARSQETADASEDAPLPVAEDTGPPQTSSPAGDQRAATGPQAVGPSAATPLAGPGLARPETRRRVAELYRENPRDPAFNALEGAAALQEGDFERADRLLTRAMSGGVRNADVSYLRGSAAMNLGRMDQALKDFDRALKLRPGHPQARDLIKLAQNKVSPAEMAKLRDRPAGEAKAGLSAGGKEGEPAAVRPGPGLSPSKAPASDLFARSDRLVQEAQGRLKVGDRAGALSVLGKAVELNPADAKARHLRADTLLRSGDDRAALEETRLLLELAPGNPGALNMRAMARNRLGEFQPALDDADLVLSARPDSALAHFNRAFALAGLGRRAAATEASRQAAALDPRFEPAHARLRELPADADPLVAFQESARPEPLKAASPPGSASDRTARWLAAAGLLAALAGLGPPLWRWRTRMTQAAGLPGSPEPPAPKAGPSPGSETLGPGVVLGEGYAVEAELGRGTMGVVYKAMDLTLKRPVAIKMLRQYARGRPESVKALLEEARLVAGLKHPGIVQIHTAMVEGDDILLVFEYVDGRPLSQVLADFHHLPLSDAKGLAVQVAGALDYAHGQRVIHRDLKPANVMVGKDGRALVMDFGLAHRARSAASSLTNVGSWGSPAYMAPEQELGEVSSSSDIYAFGACLYETLTGAPPFPGPSGLAQKQAMSFAPPSSLGVGLPPEADAVFRRALDADPAARYASARDLASALAALPDTEPDAGPD